MELTKLDSSLSTSPQIRPEEIAEIAAAGFRSIVCNRPDGEVQGQPTADQIGAAARGAGLAFAHIPAMSGCRRRPRPISSGRALSRRPPVSSRWTRRRCAIPYPNVFALGDACSASNAKTAAAARKQAPVVAVNALAALEGREPVADYDGYGSCPHKEEKGKIVIAEFGYGGKLLPSFPDWLIDGTRPSRLVWLLKGRERMVKPHLIGI